MSSHLQLFAFIVGAVFLAVIFRMMKRDSLLPSYTALWLVLTVFLVSIPLLEPVYRWAAYHVFGLYTGNDLIYIILIGFLLIYSLYLTSRIVRMNNRIQKLISSTAIMNDEIKRLKSVAGEERTED